MKYTVVSRATCSVVGEGERKGKIAEEDIPTNLKKEGYLFSGWYITSDCTGDPYDFNESKPEAFTFYAKWAVKTMTIADILATVEKFPTSVEGAWVHETAKDKVAYKGTNGYLYVGGDAVYLQIVATASGDDYVATYEKYTASGLTTNKITFHMADGVLQSLLLESNPAADADGTYIPPETPEPTEPTVTDFTTDKEQYKPDEKIVLTAKIDGLDGTIVYFVANEKQYSAASKDGAASVTISLPKAGDYDARASVGDSYKTIIITVKETPTPVPTPDPVPVKKESEEHEPLYTGTWAAPVKSGSWSQDAHGIWHYTSSETFRNTWGYIVNPYAKEGQHTADWFWFDRQGNMLTGWQFINGKWYYLNPTKDGTLGACLIGPAVTPDGWTVDESGAWIESIPKK